MVKPPVAVGEGLEHQRVRQRRTLLPRAAEGLGDLDREQPELLDLIHIPENVLELFPEDASLIDLAPVSYLGVPLLDIDGTLLGHLALLHDEIMLEDSAAISIFNIFAILGVTALIKEMQIRAIEPDAVPEFRKFIEEHGQPFIEMVDDWVTAHRANG